MSNVPTTDIRNIALTGAQAAGKTTLTERLLFDTKTISRMGSVQDANTVSDFSELEKHHQHSLSQALVHFTHHDHHVNVIDTPGLSEFAGHAIAAFPAVDTVAIVIDATKGIEPLTRRLMRVASQRNLPRLLIINKIDAADATDLELLTAQLRETFGSACLPINLPASDRTSVVNVFDAELHSESTDFDAVDDAHTRIIEQVVETDEALMAQYLDKGADSLDPAAVQVAFRAALREAHLVPICYCSATTGAGIDALLHVIADLCPSPLQGNPRTFLRRDEDGNEQPFHAEPDPDKPLIAHVFKVTADPFVGKLGVFRVHQGTVRPRDEVYLGDARKPIRIGHIFMLQGKDHVEVDEAGPGHIVAVAKIDDLHFDSVLHAHADDSIHLVPLPLPKPMFGLAIELANHADETKFSSIVHKLIEEDPCFSVERIAATRQTVMRGLGELHLRVILERLKDQHHIELNTSPPKVAYKETITAKAQGHARHKKQTGGAGQFGEVYLRVEPLPADHPTGFEFVNATVGGSIPRQFMPAIEKGIRQVLQHGAIAGYPMTGVRVEVYDGKHHAVDSKEIAFITAGKKAFIDAVHNAKPVLLEPFVDLEINVPSSHMGDIAGDLSVKRGRVTDTQIVSDAQCLLTATAPLGEVQNYTNELRSITAGQGTFSMDYSHDELTPPHIQQQVVAAFSPQEEED